jgi:hypothetical protein
MTLDELIIEGERLLALYEPTGSLNQHIRETLPVSEFQAQSIWVHTGLVFMETFYPKSYDLQFFHSAVLYGSNDKETTTHLLSILKGISNAESIKGKADYTILDTIFNRFPILIRQLKKRYGNRQAFEVNDEYDLQDLLEAVLRLHFDDVRSEEWCPSYAGGSKRMDFYLNNENIAIETKMTREGLSDKQIGEQLLIDIPNYRQHANCDKVYCFIYDPEGKIRNPMGVIKDLESLTDEITVKVIIKPD